MPVQVGPDRWHLYTADDERVWTGKLIGGIPDHTFTVRGLDDKVLRIYEHMPPGQPDFLVTLKDYIYRGDQLLASQHTVEGIRHYHLDHLGSTRQITDGAGNQVARYDYFPFGELAFSEGETAEVMRFTGHERDFGGAPETDLDYMHARHYSPYLGRFLRVDPASESVGLVTPQSWDAYSYSRSNPLKYVDPDGEITAASIADTAQQAIAETKAAATAGLSDGTAAGVFAATVVGTVFDAASLALDPLRAGEALGDAIGSGGSAVDVGKASAVDATRVMALVAPVAVGARALSGGRVLGGKTLDLSTQLFGGRYGSKVKSLVGPKNSVVRGGGERLFVTNDRGAVVLDITRDRVKPVTPGARGRGFGPKRKPTKEELALLDKVFPSE